MAGKLSAGDSYSDANHAILGATTTVSSEDLSNAVSAALNGEDGSNKYALSREIMKRKMSSESVKSVRCEFSLHEVLSGYARVTRLNGEEPKVRYTYRYFLVIEIFIYVYCTYTFCETRMMVSKSPHTTHHTPSIESIILPH